MYTVSEYDLLPSYEDVTSHKLKNPHPNTHKVTQKLTTIRNLQTV